MISEIQAICNCFSIVFSNLIQLNLLYLPIVCLSIATVAFIFRKLLRI